MAGLRCWDLAAGTRCKNPGVTVRLVGALALVVALLAPGATASDLLIRPGAGIGKVDLGMTEAQVRGVLGRPDWTVRTPKSFGRIEVELQFGAADYIVRLAGPRGRLRVAAVGTGVPRERTLEGFGVGTLERRLVRAFGARFRCERLRTRREGSTVVVTTRLRRCSLAGPRGTVTEFNTAVKTRWAWSLVHPRDWAQARVLEVFVRRVGA